MENNETLEAFKRDLISSIEQRVRDRIIEQPNADLLKKLIGNAGTETEAIDIAALGTTYKRTGFHFDKRLERISADIKYKERCAELSFQSDPARPTHQLIIGDNYDALQSLLISHHGKDSMGGFAAPNYHNAITRDNLLSMLYSRLRLARRLLTPEGVIFCSIDDKNQAYVKCLFDEVFGEENFISNVVWHSKYTTSNDSKDISKQHEYLLVYSVDRKNVEIGLLARTEEMDSAYKNPDNDPKGKWKATPLHAKSGSKNSIYTITFPNGISWSAPAGRYPRYSKEKLLEIYNEGGLYFHKTGSVDKKTYLSEVKQGKVSGTLWKYDEVGSTHQGNEQLAEIIGKGAFDNPKPIGLIQKCITISNPDNKYSTILDFFAGSGTTGQAVMELNRQDGGSRTFILCTNNEVTEANPNGIARDVTARRLRRVMTGSDYDGATGFPWLKSNQPYGDNLEVYEMKRVKKSESREGGTPFDKIDETCYGLPPFQGKAEKIEWVCRNFENATREVDE